MLESVTTVDWLPRQSFAESSMDTDPGAIQESIASYQHHSASTKTASCGDELPLFDASGPRSWSAIFIVTASSSFAETVSWREWPKQIKCRCRCRCSLRWRRVDASELERFEATLILLKCVEFACAAT
jgi:hypothetical protein